MSEIGYTLSGWVAQVAMAGGGILLFGWLAVRLATEPVVRQQIAAWTIRGAIVATGLCLLPGWWSVPLPNPIPENGTAAVVPTHTEIQQGTNAIIPHFVPESVVTDFGEAIPSGLATTEPGFSGTIPLTDRTSPSSPDAVIETQPLQLSEFLPLLVLPYAVVASGFLMQLVLGQLALAWMRRVARNAPASVQEELASLTERGDRRIELRIHERLSSPVCFGLFRWVILIPPSLAASASPAELRWILAHELDHLRRGDPWTSVWAGLCRAVFFFVPWFWFLRRELYLSQEHLADAAAAAADGRVVDYAAFLVDLSGGTQSHMPQSWLGASAVRAHHSDLFRRVTMLLNSGGQMSRRCPRRWTTIVISSIMMTAVVLSGFTWSTAAADDERPARPTDRREGDRREGERSAPPRSPRGEERGPRPPQGEFRPGFRPAEPARIRETLEKLEKAAQNGNREEVRELMGELRRLMTPPPPPPPFGERPPGERPRDGDDRRPGPRDGEGPRTGPRDGDDRRPGPRDGEGPRTGPRDGEGRRPGPRGGEGPRDGEGRRPESRDGERPRAERPPFPLFGPNPGMIREVEKSLEGALERLKDNPEAREQVQKALEQYRRAMDSTGRPPFGFSFPNMRGFPPMAPGREGPRFGLMLVPVPELVSEQLALSKNSGLAVAAVHPQSPADKAGLQKNDIVIRFAGKEVDSNIREVQEVINNLRPGDSVEVVVIRKGKKETLKTVLPKSRPERERE